jgi:hypothetical protein
MSKGFISDKGAGHAVDRSRPTHCRGNTLFKKSQNEMRKCGGALSCMNHKWILACRSAPCNNEYRMNLRLFARHLEFSSQSCTKCSCVQRPPLKLKVNTSGISFNILDAETRKPSLRSILMKYFFVLWCRSTFCRFGRAVLVHVYHICVCVCNFYVSWFLLRTQKGPNMLQNMLPILTSMYGS